MLNGCIPNVTLHLTSHSRNYIELSLKLKQDETYICFIYFIFQSLLQIKHLIKISNNYKSINLHYIIYFIRLLDIGAKVVYLAY